MRSAHVPVFLDGCASLPGSPQPILGLTLGPVVVIDGDYFDLFGQPDRRLG
jgi:hypothetical protein